MFISFLSVLLSLCACYILYSLGVGIYNITLHPLAKVPGPKLRAAFRFPTHWEMWTGDATMNRKALHAIYGSTVRLGPDSVSFNNPEAWQEIYTWQPGRKQLPRGFGSGGNAVPDIISANDADHARQRRLLNHAFSEAALREQEPLMNKYFDLLIQKLYEKIHGPTKGKVNIMRWFNFTTFDLIGDLCFGEDFGALANEDYHFWIANVFGSVKFSRIFNILRAYPLVGYPILAAIRTFPGLAKSRAKHEAYTIDKATRRIERQTDRKDFMSYILRHNDEKGMSRPEILKNSGLLILAGSETSATLLSGVMFHLLKNPSILKKLTTEIRTAFPDVAEMNMTKLAHLKYLDACLSEAFRVYPPVPGLLRRKPLPGGTVINDYFIPEGTSIGMHQLGAYYSEANFLDADKFLPERWLDPENTRFATDKRAVLQPFSIGPRNCIGQGLAMAEIRSILARVLWHFDFCLCEESQDWMNPAQHKVYLLWEKPDLWVKISARK